jgi:hypothetical protein
MSYLTIEKLQYAGSRAQESASLTSTFSAAGVDEMGTNSLAAAFAALLTGAEGTNKMPLNVPPAVAARFIFGCAA